MSRTWIAIAIVLTLSGCDAPVAIEAGPRAYLTDTYKRKQRECEARAPTVYRWDIRPDYGPSALDPKRAAVWKPQRTYLGDTCVIANAGPYYYRDGEADLPVAYAIDVEVRAIDAANDPTPSDRVLFQRYFRAADLPAGFEQKAIADIVSFDDATRKVRFAIGDRTFEYRVPTL